MINPYNNHIITISTIINHPFSPSNALFFFGVKFQWFGAAKTQGVLWPPSDRGKTLQGTGRMASPTHIWGWFPKEDDYGLFIWLVVGPPLWKIWVNWDDEIPNIYIYNIGENKIDGNQTTNQLRFGKSLYISIKQWTLDEFMFIKWLDCLECWYVRNWNNKPHPQRVWWCHGPCGAQAQWEWWSDVSNSPKVWYRSAKRAAAIGFWWCLFRRFFVNMFKTCDFVMNSSTFFLEWSFCHTLRVAIGNYSFMNSIGSTNPPNPEFEHVFCKVPFAPIFSFHLHRLRPRRPTLQCFKSYLWLLSGSRFVFRSLVGKKQR